MYAYGCMTPEQAAYEMTQDDFEAWTQYRENKREW